MNTKTMEELDDNFVKGFKIILLSAFVWSISTIVHYLTINHIISDAEVTLATDVCEENGGLRRIKLDSYTIVKCYNGAVFEIAGQTVLGERNE